MRYIWAFITFVAGANMIGLYGLGYMWLNYGYGLHPAIAYPLGTLFLILPLVLVRWFHSREYSDA